MSKAKDKVVMRVYLCSWYIDERNLQTNTFKAASDMYKFIEILEVNYPDVVYGTLEQDVLQKDVDAFEADR